MSSPAWPDVLGLALSERGQRPDVRARLLRIHIDLFVSAPARDDEAIRTFEALALGFLPLIDPAQTVEVAERLIGCPDTPDTILEYLCRRGGDAKRIVIERAPRLPRPVIAHCLASESDALLLAARPDLDRWAQEALLALHDLRIDCALASSQNFMPSDPVLIELVRRGRDQAVLAKVLLTRADLTLADEAALYLHADAERQDDIRHRIEASAMRRNRSPSYRATRDDIEILLVLAREGNVAQLGELLARIIGLEGGPDWRFLRQDRHELLALALTAADVPSDDAVRILLTIHPIIAHSARTVLHLSRVTRTVPRPTADMLVEAIVGGTRRLEPPGHHIPVMDPSGASPYGTAGAVEQRRAGDRQLRVG